MNRKMLVPLLLLLLPCLPGCYCDFLSYHEDLDIRTGRVKTTNYLLFLPVRATSHDTVITKSLPEDRVEGVEADWRKVSTLYWLIYSPYYEFCGAIHSISRYEDATNAVRFSPEALRHVALRATELWQGQTGGGGRDYLSSVAKLADEARRDGIESLDVADLKSIYDSPVP